MKGALWWFGMGGVLFVSIAGVMSREVIVVIACGGLLGVCVAAMVKRAIKTFAGKKGNVEEE